MPLFVLQNHIPIPLEEDGTPETRERNTCAWIDLMAKVDERRVAQTTVGDYWISTIFLGIDSGFFDGPPVLFETMVWCNDEITDEQERYATWEMALEGHRAMVAKYETVTGCTAREVAEALALDEVPNRDKLN